MTKVEILKAIHYSVMKSVDEPTDAKIDEETHLIKDNILDSLDSMVFLLNLSELVDVSFPEDEDLEEQGLFEVSTLIQYIEENKK
tara:strand:- start:5349 stop:5603 length:255 start_codon:yes stop_codon:yes gene_type:complete